MGNPQNVVVARVERIETHRRPRAGESNTPFTEEAMQIVMETEKI